MRSRNNVSGYTPSKFDVNLFKKFCLKCNLNLSKILSNLSMLSTNLIKAHVSPHNIDHNKFFKKT